MAFNLENQNISYFDETILSNLSLSIKKGEKIALLGKSGSGKSTLLKYLFDTKKDVCTYIPQELGLVNNLSVFHNVYIAKLDSNPMYKNILNLFFPNKVYKTEISNLLKKLELDEKIKSKTINLSGGQKQRCAIARALYHNKDILLADEPISALDEYLSNKVLETLTTNFDTTICALHNVDLATKHFDRVIGLKNGAILIDKLCVDLSNEDRDKLYYVCD